MDIHLHLPGVSPASDVDLASRMAAFAVQFLQDGSPVLAAPAGATNPCQGHCDFVKEFQDSDGNWWLLYLCGGLFEVYPA